jgi:hypothetical protein
MPDESWVKLYRSVDRAVWRKNPSILSVYVWILTHVNTGDSVYDLGGISLKKGQAAATVGSIATACGLTYDTAKYALRVLSTTGRIEVEHVSRSVRVTLLGEETTPRSSPRSLPRSSPRSSPISQEPETPTVSTLDDTSQSRSSPRSTPRSSPGSSPGTFPDAYPYISRDISRDSQDTLSYSPTRDEVKAYFTERGYKRDPDRFYAYNAMKGWERIRDWRAAADLWESHTDRKDRQDTVTNESLDISDAMRRAIEEVPVFTKGERK